MKRNIFLIVMCAMIAPVCWAASPVISDAEKADRAKLVSISAGELDDLQFELRQLRAQVAALQKKLVESSTAVKAPPPKIYRSIEVGMTREELDRFLAGHRDYKIVSRRQDSGVHADTRTTIIQNSHEGKETTVASGTMTGSRFGTETRSVGNTGANAEEVKTVSSSGKKDVLTIACMKEESYVVGTSTGKMGISNTQYGTRQIEKGRATVELVDGVVMSVEGNL